MVAYCPQCSTRLTEAELRALPLECPSCRTPLRVVLRANWAYTVVAILLGLLLAWLQGSKSILFAGATLIYASLILFIMKVYRRELGLPARVIVYRNSLSIR
jgi:hypothetical protein